MFLDDFSPLRMLTRSVRPHLNDEDVELSRRVDCRWRKIVEKRLFPHETPIGKVIRVSGHTYTIVGVLAEKGTAFGSKPGRPVSDAHYAIFRGLR